MADLVLKVTIPEANIVSFCTGFLRAAPKPEGSVLTDLEWAEDYLKRTATAKYEKGARQLANDELVITDITQP